MGRPHLFDHSGRAPGPALRPFFDELGRVRRWPSRRRLQLLALSFLADRFEAGRHYSERDVNETLDALHTFGDPTRLRRDLVDWGFLGRERDGSRYWLITVEPPAIPT